MLSFYHDNSGVKNEYMRCYKDKVVIYKTLEVSNLVADTLTYTDLSITDNFGIGVTDPTERLEVNGTVKAIRVFVKIYGHSFIINFEKGE